MAKTVDQHSTIEDFRKRYNELATDVGDASGIQTADNSVVDAINTLDSRSFYFQEFAYTATAGQTVFTGSDGNNVLQVRRERLQVFKNGALLQEGDNYILGSDNDQGIVTSITLTSGASLNDTIVFFAFTGSYLGVLGGSGAGSTFFTETAANTIYNTNESGIILQGDDAYTTELESGYNIQLAGRTYAEDDLTLASGKVITTPELVATTADINGGSVDGATIGESSRSTGKFTDVDLNGNLTVTGTTDLNSNLTVDGNTTLGNASSDTITLTGQVSSHLIPVTDGTYNLGTSSKEWNNAFFDGTVTTDALVADTADINGGTIDSAIINGTTIGESSRSTGKFTNVDLSGNLTVTGNATINGNLTFGDADTDSVAFNADVNSHLIPNIDGTYNLGTSSKEWNNAYFDGTVTTDALVANTADINGGSVDGTTIGAAVASTILGTTIGGTTITASTGFSGNLTGNVTGNVTGDIKNASSALVLDVSSGALTGSVSSISNHNTDSLSEGSTNLYFTNSRADARADVQIGQANIQDLSNVTITTPASGNLLAYNGSAWVNTAPSTTDTISEGSSNLWYTDERAQDATAAALNHSNHTNVTVAYVDASNEIRLSAASAENIFQTVASDSGNAVADATSDTLTITGGTGLETSVSGDTLTIDHTSTGAATVNNSGATVIQDLTIDGQGHLTGVNSHTLTLANLGYGGATDANNYTFSIKEDGGSAYAITSGSAVDFRGAGSVSVSRSSGIVTFTGTDTNTWRPIHDSPVDGATTTSISSNWAFDNVKTAVPASALFTDTNTTNFNIQANSGATTNISAGETMNFVNGTDINITRSGNAFTVNSTGSNAAITSNGSTPSLASGITGAEVRSLIGAGTSSSDTTYSVGDGGLTQKNFTSTLKTKLDSVDSNATLGFNAIYGYNGNVGAGYVMSMGASTSNKSLYVQAGTGISLSEVTNFGGTGKDALKITNTVVNTDTNTVTSVGANNTGLSTGNIYINGSGATSISKSGGTITINSTDTNTDTNTTYTAGTGMSLSGTTFNCNVVNTDTNTTYTAGTGLTLVGTQFRNTVVNTDTNTTYSAGNGMSLSGTQFLMSGSYSGTFTASTLHSSGDVIAYYSDERLKDFEGTIPNALDKVSQLNGYYFTANETAKELGFDNDQRQVGVSAQEVEAIMPEIIKSAPINEEHGTDYKTVQYEKLVPLLIEAIKELKGEIEELKGNK
jgi:hypothetical protein